MAKRFTYGGRNYGMNLKENFCMDVGWKGETEVVRGRVLLVGLMFL